MTQTNGHSNGSKHSMPEDNRVEPGSADLLPAIVPKTSFPTTEFDLNQVAADFIQGFNKGLQVGDYNALSALFTGDGFWRDHLGLSWEHRTLRGPSAISKFLVAHGERLKSVSLDQSAPHRAPSIGQLDVPGNSKFLNFFTTFTSDVGSGRGIGRLTYQDNTWKLYNFYTALMELTGHDEPRGARRRQGVEHSGSRDIKNWQEQRMADLNYQDSDPAVLIIGMRMRRVHMN
jgi:hypothetical protein